MGNIAPRLLCQVETVSRSRDPASRPYPHRLHSLWDVDFRPVELMSVWMSRFWLVPLILTVFVIVPFAIWGDRIETMISLDADTGTLGAAGSHAGLVGILLLVSDLVLPIPTTSIIAGLGILYGPVLGTVFALIGAMLAALVGYALGRIAGRPLAQRWLGTHLVSGERAFQRHGGWIVAASRWMPVLPEVISVSAGISRMPLAAFLLAAFCGALPHCAVFAIIGHLGAATPIWTIAISALIPLVLWFIADRAGWMHRLGTGRAK